MIFDSKACMGPRKKMVDKLACSVNGVITGKHDEFVTVKFSFVPDVDIIIDFPVLLFADDLIHYGQPVSYEIRERLDGTHYDAFSARQDNKKNPHLEEVEELLGKITLW